MIELTDVHERDGSTVAVDHTGFEVRPGEVTGFLGPDGAGTSTTMRMIVSLDAPTSGRVTIDGRPSFWDLRLPSTTWAPGSDWMQSLRRVRLMRCVRGAIRRRVGAGPRRMSSGRRWR